MKIRPIFLVACLAATASVTVLFTEPSAHGQIIFEDGFESPSDNFLRESPVSGRFTWTQQIKTSIVTQTAGGNAVALGGNGLLKNPIQVKNDGKDWTAFEGENSLRFRYDADQPWTEQRFDLGGAYEDVWFSYQLRVPTNFVQPGSNGKLFAIWMDEYDGGGGGDGPSMTWNSWPDGGGDSRSTLVYSEATTNALGHVNNFPSFIDVSTDLGRWMEVVINVKSEVDGSIRIWRRWEEETEYENIHTLESINLSPSSTGPGGWGAGYIMGWQNNAYAEETEWLLDNFKVSQSSLLTTAPEPSGDFDEDGDTDGDDFLLWQRDASVGNLSDWEANFGTVLALAATAGSPVPEPSSAAMMLLTASSSAAFWRRRRS